RSVAADVDASERIHHEGHGEAGGRHSGPLSRRPIVSAASASSATVARRAARGGRLSARARILLAVAALAAVAAGAAVTLFYLAFVRDLPDFRSLDDYRPALTSVVLDRNGTAIGEFYEFRRRVVPLEQVPKHVIQAFLAA